MTKSMMLSRFGGLVVLCAVIFAAAPAQAKDDPAVASEVIGLARNQWAAEIAGKGAADQLASVADDYTEFNPDYPTLLVGKSMAAAMLSVPQAGVSVFSDMQNPRVQVYGDTAILTYNFAGIGKSQDGKITPNTAKSTRVYVRQNGRWMLVHANFAPVAAAK